jgi:tRNA (guanosine-2'-O-)-methyltransferase
MPTERRKDKIREVLLKRQRDLTVVCENIHDPHNVSAILRSCDAVGIPIVHLLYTNEAFPKLGRKSSASAKKWIQFVKHKNHNSLKNRLKQENFIIYATSINSTSKNIYDIDWTKPSAIIMGNEHRGVSKEILEIADQKIFIPMFGMVKSLNVSVATAVILYEICRQRILAGNYDGNYEDKWVKEQYNLWTKI